MDYDNRNNAEINKNIITKREKQKTGKVLNIDGREYILEYGSEAIFDTDCLSSLTGFWGDIGESESKGDVKSMLVQFSNIPKITLELFYAGLMEHHGMHGDKTVPDKETAKGLIMKYISENKKEKMNFAVLFGICMGRMQEDGFLEVLGLEGLLEGHSPQIATKEKVEK